MGDIIITEKMCLNTISKSDFNLIKECENPRIWADFTRRQRSQKKDRFNQIIKTYGLIGIKIQLKNLMFGAINNMLSYTSYHNSTYGAAVGCYLPIWQNSLSNNEEQNQAHSHPC